MERELWNRYASLATELRFSEKLSCLTTDQPCFVASVDQFCQEQADQGQHAWQSCVSALVQFIASSGPAYSAGESPASNVAGDKQEADKMSGFFATTFATQHNQLEWVVRAIEFSSFHILSDFDRLKSYRLDDSIRESCQKTSCYLNHLESQGIHIYLKGGVDPEKLTLRIYDVASRTLVSERTFAIDSKPDLTDFKIEIFRLIQPFTKQGGILDEIEARQQLIKTAGEPLFSKQKIVKAFASIGEKPEFRLILDFVWQYYPFLGGLLWGWLFLKVVSLIFPKIFQFEHLAQRMLSPLLKSWVLVSLWRGGWVLMSLTPFVAVAALLQAKFNLSSTLTWSFLAPLLLLTGLFFWALILEIIAKGRDRQTVIDQASTKNPVDQRIRNYLHEQARRQRLEIDQNLLKRTVFLPQKEPRVVTYGGALGRSRIAINVDLLRLALGDWETESDAVGPSQDEIPVTFEPDEEGEHPADSDEKDDDLRLQKDKKLRSRFMKWEAFRKLLSFKDFEVDAEGEEGLAAAADEATQPEKAVDDHDELDPNFIRRLEAPGTEAKDFLYGLLLSELGTVYSRHALFWLINDGFGGLKAKAPTVLKYWGDKVGQSIQRHCSRFARLIDDSFVISHQGLPHLIQYFYYDLTTFANDLTTDAEAHELWQTSRQQLNEALALPPAKEDRFINQATTRNRLLWARRYLSSEQSEQPEGRSLVRIFRWLALCALVIFVLIKINESVEYSDIYQQRLTDQLAEREEEKKPSP
jgi:hypothetical protein